MTMQQAKMAGLACLIALTVLGAGYLWGARGRWAGQDRLAVVESQAPAERNPSADALYGQMALTRLNFGEAAGLFESARAESRRRGQGSTRAKTAHGTRRGQAANAAQGPDRSPRPGGQAQSGLGGEGR